MSFDIRNLPRPIAAIMQPTFLPWQGYFGMIEMSDIFVFLDDVQFVRRSFHHRNRIFGEGASVDWITIPVADTGQQTRIDAAGVSLDANQQRKMMRRLQHIYGRMPHFDSVFSLFVERLERNKGKSLADLNIDLIVGFARLAGFAPTWKRSAELAAEGQRSSKISAILERIGAKSYISAGGSFDYMRTDGIFPLPNIRTAFFSFEAQSYPQRQAPDFVPNLSILDALFQIGGPATGEAIKSGLRTPMTWGQRAAVGAALEV